MYVCMYVRTYVCMLRFGAPEFGAFAVLCKDKGSLTAWALQPLASLWQLQRRTKGAEPLSALADKHKKENMICMHGYTLQMRIMYAYVCICTCAH